jgi:hypothetical protein
MKIYYRGYLISKIESPDLGCMIFGKRPERPSLVTEDDTRLAMRWIDRDVIRQKVRDAGWLTSQAIPA